MKEAQAVEPLWCKHRGMTEGPIYQSCYCSTEDDEETINTQQPMWQLHKMPHSRERTLPNKRLHWPFLTKDWSLEPEVQEV